MRRLIPSAFLALLFLAGANQLQAQVDLTGTWEISSENQRGARTTTFTFVQDGNTFTGTAQMAAGGPRGGGGGAGTASGTREIQITDGKIEGNTFTFTMTMGMGERSMSMTYSGTIDGNAMQGTITNPRGENPFTGVKK